MNSKLDEAHMNSVTGHILRPYCLLLGIKKDDQKLDVVILYGIVQGPMCLKL